MTVSDKRTIGSRDDDFSFNSLLEYMNEKGITKFHFDWTDEGHKLSSGEKAKYILDTFKRIDKNRDLDTPIQDAYDVLSEIIELCKTDIFNETNESDDLRKFKNNLFCLIEFPEMYLKQHIEHMKNKNRWIE